MSTTNTPRHHDRLLELLADRALDALTPESAYELDRLAAIAQPGFDLDAMDRAAAALATGWAPEENPPAHVRARLDDAAAQWLAQAESRPARARPPVIDAPARRIGAKPARSPLAVAGWFVAAAALLFAAMVWATRPGPSGPGAVPSLAEQRRQLIERATDLVRVPWQATGDPAAPGAVKGEIVWSDKLNRGFMTFEGLAANNPGREQYQLWIFDADRDERYPVDGGVFDIPAPNELTVVEVDPRLHVDHATLFAVTVEKPGGVVVSSRERLLVLAKPEAPEPAPDRPS